MRLLPLLLLATALPCCAQWYLQDAHTSASLRGIHAVSDQIAWASGTGGTVLRTLDGGLHWEHCATPPGAESLDFRGIQAFDASTAIVMSSGKGDLSRLYKTRDGCKSWKLLFTNPDKDGFWDAIQFLNRDEGVLLGDPVDHMFSVMLTFNGGNKWERQSLRTTEDINGESVFAASNSSLLLSSSLGYRQFCTGGHGGPRLITFSASIVNDTPGNYEPDHYKLHYFREQGAEHLQTKYPSFDSSGCFSIARNVPLGITVVVGGNFQKPDDRDDTAWTSAIIRSKVTDWSSFHPSDTPPHGYRSAVTYDAAHKLWITVGPNGTDISTDDGRNWRALRPLPSQPADADQHWNALSLPFVVGPNGRIGRLNPAAISSGH